MKRFTSILLALGILSACSSDRSGILKVYNWSCYIDENLIGEFEDWYEEQTGERVQVIYQTFDVNETMLSKIELGHEDYDVVCPSDYIIEKMLKEDLLLPIERNFGDTPDYLSNISPFITSFFNQIEGSGKNANDYAVGYMWGTNGLLFNPKFVPDEETYTWDVLKNSKYFGNILMKDAFRDVYTSILISLNKDDIDIGDRTLNEVSMDSSDESIKLIEEYIGSFKEGIAGWEADFGKEQMVKERAWLSFNWSGDAQWAIDEAAMSGVELRYSVPKTGSTIWFDGWVIPKYAKNTKAASYFINFMCMPANAVRNMEVIGYVSTVAGDEIYAAQNDSTAYGEVDASYFFGPDATRAHVSPVQYPDKSIIARCGMLHDSGADTAKLLEMWSRVKGDSATNWTLIVIIFAALAFVGAVIAKKRSNNHKKYSHRRKK